MYVKMFFKPRMSFQSLAWKGWMFNVKLFVPNLRPMRAQ